VRSSRSARCSQINCSRWSSSIRGPSNPEAYSSAAVAASRQHREAPKSRPVSFARQPSVQVAILSGTSTRSRLSDLPADWTRSFAAACSASDGAPKAHRQRAATAAVKFLGTLFSFADSQSPER
jgi:hypothetical protein